MKVKKRVVKIIVNLLFFLVASILGIKIVIAACAATTDLYTMKIYDPDIVEVQSCPQQTIDPVEPSGDDPCDIQDVDSCSDYVSCQKAGTYTAEIICDSCTAAVSHTAVGSQTILTCSSPSTNRFIIKNSSSDNIASFDENGYLFLNGRKAELLYHLDEANGDVYDSSGGGRDVTPTGSPTYGVSGKIDTAMTFAASGDMLLVSPVVNISNMWTVSTWFNYPLEESTHWRTLTRGLDGDHQIIVGINNYTLGTFDNTGAAGFLSSGYDVDVLSNGWHHLAAVQDGTDIIYYIDGSEVGRVTNYQSITDIYAIGNYQGGAQEWGTIDEFAIYNTALSAADINNLYSTTSYSTLQRFTITDSSSNTVASIDSFGNLYLNGIVSGGQGSVSPPANSFVIQNSVGTSVAYIDSSGNLGMLGWVYDEWLEGI